MPRDKQIYRETYVPVPFKKEALPKLNHISEGSQKFVVTGCELRAAGVIERGGKRMEYHDLRVYVEAEK